jgi:hypothetical protein
VTPAPGMALQRTRRPRFRSGRLCSVTARAAPVRRLLYAATALGIALVVASCREKPFGSPRQPKPNQVKGEKRAPVVEGRVEQGDSRERSRQCTAQAKRLADRNAWIEGRRAGPLKVLEWSSHYSHTYRRCFVQVSFFREDAVSTHALPLIVYSLFDAYENTEVASCTDAVNEASASFCAVSEPGAESDGDCAACRRFINERMSK